MNFKDTLNLYAKYNMQANADMLRILGTLPDSRLGEAVGSYYKTLAGLLDHGLRSTLASMKRVSDAGLLPELLPTLLASLPQPPAGSSTFTTLSEFASLRTRADEALVALCAAARESDLEKTTTFLGRDKQPRTIACGGNLLALFTHEIHHRGGVSTILDGWGVENDWSSLMRFLFL